MIFKIKAIIHKDTTTIKTTEEFEAQDPDEAIFLFKTRHAENIAEIISLDTTPSPPHNETPSQFVTQGWQDFDPNTSTTQQNPGGHDGSHTGLPG
jgi:hypothetical protein